MTIGERIRRRRIALALAQRELASDGVSYAYISRIEIGRRTPSIKALRMLAHKLDTSVHWLETGKHDPADRLAQLVLAHGDALPKEATSLARAVLRTRR
jgi:transcriptional regulator with XRE-family HTH domain